MMKHQVICFGEILWDCFGQIKKAGGAPMNVALHLHKQGVDSMLISAVGDDSDGKKLTTYLQEQGLSTKYIQTDPDLPTGIVDVHLDEHNQATYTIVKPVAWDKISYAAHFNHLISDADALVFGSLACREETSKATLLKLMQKAKLKVFDMNLRPPHFSLETLEELMQQADILKLNEDELTYLSTLYNFTNLNESEQLIQLSKRFNLQTICVTLGDKGALVLHLGKLYQHAGYKVNVADTVGAGDAFLATFINGLLQQDLIPKILESSCATGAFVASRHGANPDYQPEDVLEIINYPNH